MYLLPLRGAADTVPPPTLWRAPPQPVDVELVDALPELQAVSLQRCVSSTLACTVYPCCTLCCLCLFPYPLHLLLRVLRPLVGQSLDFTALSRALEEGKDPMCTLYRAEVHAVTLPTAPGVWNAPTVYLRRLTDCPALCCTVRIQQGRPTRLLWSWWATAFFGA